MLATFLRWHHRLGVLTCLALLMWGLSGISHPLMSRLQPRPSNNLPPEQSVSLATARPLAELLRARGWPQLAGASLATLDQRAHYRVTLRPQEPARYLDVMSGLETPEGERLHAQELARHYAGLPQTRIASSRRLTAFDADYHATNRLLPVWRIEFDRDDHLTAYIDVDQARLATLVDDRKRQLSRWFQFGHDWSFLADASGPRLALMTLALALIWFSAASGLWFFLRLRRQAKQRLRTRPLARWHRWLGAVVGLTTLTFATSGTLHLWMSERRDALAAPPIQTGMIPVEALGDAGWQSLIHAPLARLQLVSHAGQAAWLVQAAAKGQASGPPAQVAALAMEAQARPASRAHSEHAEHGAGMGRSGAAIPRLMLHDTRTGAMLEDGALGWAAQLAQTYAASWQAGTDRTPQLASRTWVTRFDEEYGFINKRLPVVRVTLQNDPQHTRYFIEPATGTLAARIDDLDMLEGRCFAWLHKWRFTEAGKDIRDLLQVLVVLTTIGVALAGLTLFIRRQRGSSQVRQAPSTIQPHSSAP